MGVTPILTNASIALELRLGKTGLDAHLLPAVQLHAGRVEGRRHAHGGALIGPLVQKLHAGVAQVLVAHAGDLHVGDRNQIGRAVDASQRGHDLHRALHAGAGDAIQQVLVLQKLGAMKELPLIGLTRNSCILLCP